MISQAVAFIFESFSLEPERKNIRLVYGVTFDTGTTLKLVSNIHLPQAVPERVSSSLLDLVLHPLHLIIGISYWKMYCPRKIIINTRPLDKTQAFFWDSVYIKGLGEFFFKNEMDFKGLISFPFTSDTKIPPPAIPVQNRTLVGIAGGKDSLLSFELLKRQKKEIRGVVFETNHPFPLICNLVKFMEEPALFIRHSLDPKIYELHKTGLIYNGHIPISAVNAFLGIMTAIFYDYSYFIVSNERSSNVGNVDYLGMEINHQWSKSYEFEQLFTQYVVDYITPSVTYLSLLRPLSELKIVELFSTYKKYFPHFSSCNKNFTVFKKTADSKWCGKCAKCAFVFTMFSAYLSKGEMIKLFGKNMYEDESLIPTFFQLLGILDIKPFECVGTFEEVLVAMHTAYERGEYVDDPVMKKFKREVIPHIKEIKKLKEAVLSVGDVSHFPQQFKNIFTLL